MADQPRMLVRRDVAGPGSRPGPAEMRIHMIPGTVGAAARQAGSQAFRVMGAATARYRPDPDFIVIGAKRGGTTSLYYDILKIPAVLPLFPSSRWLPKRMETKGTHFFDTHYRRGENWYRSYLPTRWARQRAAEVLGGRVAVGEASPYYLFHPLAAERAARMVPNVRLIAILRDPVMRSYSHWKERRRNNAESLNFADAVAVEGSRLAGEEDRLRSEPDYYSYAHEQQSYVAQSMYARALRPWIERFGRENLLILISEEYYADPGASLAQVADFLGIRGGPVGPGEHLNTAAGVALDPGVREQLTPVFAADIEELEEMLGRALPWH